MFKTNTLYLFLAACLAGVPVNSYSQGECNRVLFASGQFNSNDALNYWTKDASWVYIDANQLMRNNKDNITGSSVLSQALTVVSTARPVTITFTYRFAEGSETGTINDQLSVQYGGISYLSIQSTANATGNATFAALNGATVTTMGALSENNNISVTLTLPAGQPAAGTLAFDFYTEDYPGAQTNDDIILDNISLMGDCVAFPCNYSSIAQILNRTTSTDKKRTSLEQVDITSGSLSPYYNYFPMDNIADGAVINATGYNLLDGCVYGYVKKPGIANLFVKIDGTGSVTTFTIPNVVLNDYNTGDITPDGYYYITSGLINRYYCIDLNPARATYLKMVDPIAGFIEDLSPYGTVFSSNALSSGQIQIADWSYNPNDGMLYSIYDGDANAAHARRVMALNPLTGTVTVSSAAITGGGIGLETSGFGAQFMGPNDYFLVYGNTTGNYYKINLANNTATMMINGAANTSNDGSRCSLAPFVATDFGDMNSFEPGSAIYATAYAEMLGGDINADGKPDNANGVWFGDQVSNDYNTDYRDFSTPRAAFDNYDDGFTITGIMPDAQGNPTNTLIGGQTYTFNLSATANSTGNAQWGMWYDVNGDGDFTDAEDIFMNGNILLTGTATNTINFPVTIPATGTAFGATEGRIRFAVTRDVTNPFQQGANGEVYLSNGEVEDYYVSYREPLPVKLTAFGVRKDGENATLVWETAMEQNTDKFIAEHSVDGRAFDKIGEVMAVNTSTGNKYSFIHAKPGSGQHYYRLQILDKNGSYTYSPLQVINFGNSEPVILMYPNPINAVATLTGLSANDEVRVLSTDGRVELVAASTGNSLTLDIAAIAPGFHMVQVLRDGAVIKSFKANKR